MKRTRWVLFYNRNSKILSIGFLYIIPINVFENDPIFLPPQVLRQMVWFTTKRWKAGQTIEQNTIRSVLMHRLRKQVVKPTCFLLVRQTIGSKTILPEYSMVVEKSIQSRLWHPTGFFHTNRFRRKIQIPANSHNAGYGVERKAGAQIALHFVVDIYPVQRSLHFYP